MSAHPEQHFRWSWELAAPPEALWPLVSNTDRFNRDCGYPPVTLVPPAEASATSSRAPMPDPVTNSRRLRAQAMGMTIEWDEYAFEWLEPARFGVERIFHRGPVAKLVMTCDLSPGAGGGTTLVYQMWITPASLPGRLLVPWSFGRKAREATERVFRSYDTHALRGLRSSQLAQRPRLAAGRRRLPLRLTAGRYRVRSPRLAAQHAFRVAAGAAPTLRIDVGATSLGEPAVAPAGELTLVNDTGTAHLAVLEHLAWSDQATTAAEVTSLQLFRDLFSREVLRPGEKISVGTMTVVFTDLKNSTQLYKDIGDAPAFGRVLTHFEILKAAVAAENGGIVKSMGDAIMAVFPRPVSALRAMLHAQRWLAEPQHFAFPAGVTVPPSSLKPLELKAGIHCGPCLAINQNERLDYFGTTVNITARLCGLGTGADLVLSDAVRHDPEVAASLAAADTGLHATADQARLRGLGDEAFAIWRVTQR